MNPTITTDVASVSMKIDYLFESLVSTLIFSDHLKSIFKQIGNRGGHQVRRSDYSDYSDKQRKSIIMNAAITTDRASVATVATMLIHSPMLSDFPTLKSPIKRGDKVGVRGPLALALTNASKY